MFYLVYLFIPFEGMSLAKNQSCESHSYRRHYTQQRSVVITVCDYLDVLRIAPVLGSASR